MFKQIVLLCLPVGRVASDLGQILPPLTAAQTSLCQRYLLMSESIRIRPVQRVFITQQTWSCAICVYRHLQMGILIGAVTVRECRLRLWVQVKGGLCSCLHSLSGPDMRGVSCSSTPPFGWREGTETRASCSPWGSLGMLSRSLLSASSEQASSAY